MCINTNVCSKIEDEGGDVMLRDRGRIKWQGAFFMPEHVKMLNEVKRDDLKVAKPILDEYQIEEYGQKLLLAMEFTYRLKIQVWENGFLYDYSGKLHRIDEIYKIIYLETDEKLTKLKFEDMVDVELMDK